MLKLQHVMNKKCFMIRYILILLLSIKKLRLLVVFAQILSIYDRLIFAEMFVFE